MVFIVRRESGLSRPGFGSKVIKANDFWTYRLAVDTVADARRRHDEIVSRAKAAFLAEQQRGYQEGSEAARLEQSRRMVQLVADTVAYFSRIEGQMADLVMNAMRQIINGYDDRARALEVVRNCLSLVRNQRQLRLRVHPANLELVKSHLAEMLKSHQGNANVDLVSDRQLAADACVIETEIGTVEASLSGQLKILHEAFARVFGPQSVAADGKSPSTTLKSMSGGTQARRTLV